jgi:gluconokinase
MWNAMVIVVMGVTGAGKSTIGRALAAALGWEFHDGDDLHSEESKRKMHRGEPLTDFDRGPWIIAVRQVVQAMLSSGTNGVVACSALKQSYRNQIVGDAASVKLVYLKGSQRLIGERLAGRIGHFMNPELLQSQFDTLEEPDDRDAIVVDISMAPEAIVADIRARLGV